ncbi:MAG TPA: hypothetical protein PKM09_07750, partial [Bacillota bacterium]|nr:hypothetical protein [Bacillota bacterium]
FAVEVALPFKETITWQAPSWPNDGHGISKRLELACTRILTLLSEIAAKFEYIDFGWPLDDP